MGYPVKHPSLTDRKHAMKVFRLDCDIPTDYAYIEYSGFDSTFSHKFWLGEKVSHVDFTEMVVKNVTKTFPNMMWESVPFVNKEMKAFLVQHTDVDNLHFIECMIRQKPYYLLNIVGLKDCMDYHRSIFSTFELKPELPDAISYLALHTEQLSECEMFRLKEEPTHIFVTEPLKEKIEAQGFTGVEFIQAEDLTQDY